jgi:hypothetical protein
MRFNKADFFIINGSFGFRGNVIGYSLLQFATRVAASQNVCVFEQAMKEQQKLSASNSNARDEKFFICSGFSGSKNGLVIRVLEIFYVVLWVFIKLLRQRPAKGANFVDKTHCEELIISLFVEELIRSCEIPG